MHGPIQAVARDPRREKTGRISMIQQRKNQETMVEKLDPNGPMCIKS